MEAKKYYAVFGLFSKLEVLGSEGELPKGQYIIPVFDDYEDAKRYADNRFDVVELTSVNKDE